jgi:hypothetical protein
MICPVCGANIPDGSKFCTGCGATLVQNNSLGQNVNNAVNNVNQMFSGAEQQLGNTFNSIRGSFNGGGAPRGPRLKTDRSLLMVILLSLITLGIYTYYFIYSVANDVNTACDGDGQSTSGLIAFLVLSMITCGIYSYYWYYKLGNRLADNAYRYNMQFSENGTTVLLWMILGSMLCGIGPLIAMNIIIKNTNAICRGYNQANGYGM